MSRRYYISDRRALGGAGALLRSIEAAAAEGVDWIQIREKDLTGRDLALLVREALRRTRGYPARVLVNDRLDVALACGAHGVHLRTGSLAPRVLRGLAGPGFLIGVSCHHACELEAAEREGADFAVMGPVYETSGKGPAIGVAGFSAAVKTVRMPVLALGGVTRERVAECLAAGAAGVAGIRLFAQCFGR